MNHMTFDTQNKTEVVKFNELISFLISYNASNLDVYNEIHIYQEEALIVLEWEQVPYSMQYGGKFIFVDEDHVVLKDVRFPDGHYEYLDDEDEDEIIEKWLEDNPGWTRTPYGNWTNDSETQIFNEYLKDHTIAFSDLEKPLYTDKKDINAKMDLEEEEDEKDE